MRRAPLFSLMLFTLGLAPLVARAQALAPPPPVLNAVPAPAAQPVAPPPAEGRETDASIDRGFLMSTAETLPRGAVVFSDTELLLMGFSAGVTDSLQLSFASVVPTGEGMIFNMGAKLRVLKVARFRLALTSSLWAAVPDHGNNDFLFVGGPVASFCLDQRCESMVTGQMAVVTEAFKEGSSPTVLGFGGSLLMRITDHAKLMVEIDTAARFSAGDDGTSAGLFGYGVRLHTNRMAADIGFLKPFDDNDSDLPMGLPYLNLSYRFN